MKQLYNIVFLSTIVLFFLTALNAQYFIGGFPYIAYGNTDGSGDIPTIVFTGDIMLAREVERIMGVTNPRYPFRGVENLLSHADVVVGNFEGSVPKEHIETPDFGFRFSVRNEFLQTLQDVGFDILSLANNHSFDFGEEGYMNTKERCIEISLACVGKSGSAESFSVTTLQSGNTTIGLFMLEVVTVFPETEDIVSVFAELVRQTDVQIVYVHWGTEYEKNHSASQEILAHTLIDAGADAIIGHHPHVVQDIEIYHDRPIFYSLGNFVFDQYFDQDVQEGLIVQLEIREQHLSYTLIPVSSINTPSQPQIMGIDQKEIFIADLLSRSSVGKELAHGHIITVPRYTSGLASTEINSTMGPQ